MKNANIVLVTAPNKINKHLIGNDDGSVTNLGSAQPDLKGSYYEVVEIKNLKDLLNTYLSVTNHQMSILGTPKTDEGFYNIGDRIKYGIKGTEGLSREKDNWGFPSDRQGFVSIDFDHFDRSTDIEVFAKDWMKTHVKGDVSYFVVSSSSYDLFNTATNKYYKDEIGFRLIFLVEKASMHEEFYKSWIDYENLNNKNLYKLGNNKLGKPAALEHYSFDKVFYKQPQRNNYHCAFAEGALYSKERTYFIYEGAIEYAGYDNMLSFSKEDILKGEELLKKQKISITKTKEYNEKRNTNLEIFANKEVNKGKNRNVIEKEFNTLKEGILYPWDSLVDAEGNVVSCEEIYKDVMDNENKSKYIRGDNTWCQPGEPEYAVCADITFRDGEVRVHSFGHGGAVWYIQGNAIDTSVVETHELLELNDNIISELNIDNDKEKNIVDEFEPVITIDYIEDYKSFEDYINIKPINDTEILALTQPTGGFKTTNVYKNFADKKLIGVTPRCSLTSDIVDSYKVLDYNTDYKTISRTKKSFATTLNSIINYNALIPSYTYSFFDESSMALPMVFSNIVSDNRKCFDVYKNILMNTKPIMADAYASEEDWILQGKIANKNIRILANREFKKRGVDLYINKNKLDGIDRLFADIEKDNSFVYVYSSFKKEAFVLKQKVLDKYPNKKVVVYSADNEGQVSELLQNLKTKCDIDVLIVTPALCTGVSIVIPNTRNAYVHAFGETKIDTIDSIAQSINRVRNAKTISLTMTFPKESEEKVSFDDTILDIVNDMCISSLAKSIVGEDIGFKNSLAKMVFNKLNKDNNSYNSAFIQNHTNELNRSRKCHKDLIELLSKHGYNVILDTVKLTKEEKAEEKARHKEMVLADKEMKAMMKEQEIVDALESNIDDVHSFDTCEDKAQKTKLLAYQTFRLDDQDDVTREMIISVLDITSKEKRENAKMFIAGDISKATAIAAAKNKKGKLHSTQLSKNTLILTISSILGEFEYDNDGSFDKKVISEEAILRFAKFNDTNIDLIEAKGLKVRQCGNNMMSMMKSLNMMLSNFNMYAMYKHNKYTLGMIKMYNDSNICWKLRPLEIDRKA